MTFLLAGDIGGTKTILRLVEYSEASGLNTTHEDVFPSGDFPDLVPIVQKFLAAVDRPQVTKACFAIAVLWSTILLN